MNGYLKSFTSHLFSVLFLATFAHQAFAAASGEAAAWVGALGGISVPNYANTTSRTMMGVNAGAKVGTELGVGAYYLTSSKDENVSGVTTPFGYDLYGVMGGYFFEGEAKGVHLGLMLGMSKVTSKYLTDSVSTSPMHWGLVAGYDHMLGDFFSLGGSLNFISIANSTASTTSGTWLQAGFSTLNFLASLKFWF
jgi:hypothetical protein